MISSVALFLSLSILLARGWNMPQRLCDVITWSRLRHGSPAASNQRQGHRARQDGVLYRDRPWVLPSGLAEGPGHELSGVYTGSR